MSFINGHFMTTPVQLHGGSQTGGSASDNSDLFTGPYLGRFRFHPALRISGFNDGTLVFFGRYRLPVYVTGTGGLTESRTHTAGKLRKAVSLGQSQIRLFEISTVYQIIGLRHQIVQRTAGSHTADHAAGLAEGNAALHAARCLLSLFFQLQRSFELMEMLDPLKRSFRCGSLPFIL
ncbi:Uncharacterised protein [uncultured Clostridium sp.]|nr:Uncharacterised protein [uncultured Clostridium sp.]